MTLLHIHLYLTGLGCWIIQNSHSLMLPGASELLYPSNRTERHVTFGNGFPRIRRKRAITSQDMNAILEYHNKVRAQVVPQASNMEYMLWDENLAKSAESWAAQCIWDHGPPQVLKHAGQNISIQSGRFRSILDLVKPWYEENQHYSFPYPQECQPKCPTKCTAVCGHYTQMVWATTNRMGCAVHVCSNINVWGSTWQRALYLVCNYSGKGNWIGEAPYKLGAPCSACPPSYGGVCHNNLCYVGAKHKK